MKRESTTVSPATPGRLWSRRLGWLLLLWLGGVLAVGVIALFFRAVMAAIGLTR
ncbi:MAG: DUF2474 family protein [Betaproteobacteria bacterium]